VWNALLGVSLAFWRDKHRRHHADTHQPGRDPDLYALFGHDAGAATSASRLHRAFLRRRHWFFWPATLFARAHYLLLGVAHAARLRGRERVVELGLIAVHHVLFVGGAVAVLGPRAAAFLAIHLAVAGAYMGLAFATNHLGMPYAARPVPPGRAWQAAHTRNVRTGRLGDYLLGGLNHQIEHHLYPAVPRAHLRECQADARASCQRAGVPYHSVGLGQALREVHRGLRSEARGVAP
jgi:fatty acid desaturase